MKMENKFTLHKSALNALLEYFDMWGVEEMAFDKAQVLEILEGFGPYKTGSVGTAKLHPEGNITYMEGLPNGNDDSN